jgi:hypothetical protein
MEQTMPNEKDPESLRGEVIASRLAELRAEQTAGFYRPERHKKSDVAVVNTANTTSYSSLEQPGCVHCNASYGHTIKCPTWNREAAEELSDFDNFFLKSLRISPLN